MGIVTGTSVTSGRSGHGPRAMATLLLISVASVTVLAQGTQEAPRNAAADWPTYNRDLAGTRYSPLTEIDPSNVTSLREAWSYKFHSEDDIIEALDPTEVFQQVTRI
jgi:glucose dehydrogenase